MTLERRLAAILAADVVGYSRLMAANEAQTLSRLQSILRNLIQPKIDEYGGRIVKLMGDGLLADFPSTVNAVKCAVELQDAVSEQERSRPDEERICFRVGINLGDIIIDGDDIFGDGVNVAARLEALAEPNGICLSGTAFDTVDGKVEYCFEDMGPQAIKNIAKPLQTYRLAQPPTTRDSVTHSAPFGRVSEKPAIAVLPFSNVSGDTEQEYFADGIAEDIITRLGRCRWLRVIARNSTYAYKGKSTDVRQIAKELGTRYVLEGSVRRSGQRVRITTQLIDGRDGSQLWGEQFDRTLEDIFDVQDEITSIIAGTLEPELETREGAELGARAIVDLGAWDCYQRALWHLYHFNQGELGVAEQLLQRAIEIDPSFSQAFARLAYVHIQYGWYGRPEDRALNIERALGLARQAVELDSKDPTGRLALGRALTLSGNTERGIEELKTAILLDPSFAQGHFALAQAYCYLDRHSDALPEIEEALRLSPRDPHLWTFLHVRGLANYQAGKLIEAEVDERNALRQPNCTHWPYLILLAVLGRQQRSADANSVLAELQKKRPEISCADCREELRFGDHRINSEAFERQFLEDLRAAGLPE
jgi:TolB-like protein/class 3 adenylate cyclase